MSPETRRYISFLLRLWQVKQDGAQIWRASLDDPRTGERRRFASLTTLLDFLNQQMQEEPEKDQAGLLQEQHKEGGASIQEQ